MDFRKGQGMYSHGAFNSSYAALYYPWIEINDPVTGKRKLVPPSGAVAGCYRPQRQEDPCLVRARGHRPRPGLQRPVPGLQDQPGRAGRPLSRGRQRDRFLPRQRHQHLGAEDAAEPAVGARPMNVRRPDDVHRGSHRRVLAVRGLRAQQPADLARADPADQPLHAGHQGQGRALRLRRPVRRGDQHPGRDRPQRTRGARLRQADQDGGIHRAQLRAHRHGGRFQRDIQDRVRR
ncbi:MAG: hypothetical protein MZV70_52070 [Desulfobacterales bacterium]|nr:hypothetical protein [Desulfobacterales bacterium]